MNYYFFKYQIFFFLCLFFLIIVSCKKNPSSSDDDSTSQYDTAPLAFEDDFSQNTLNWQIYSGNWYISNSALYVDGPYSPTNHIAVKETGKNFTQPFKYIIDIDYITGFDQNTNYGIGFGNDEKGIFYMINQYYDTYSLQEIDSTGWNLLRGWNYSGISPDSASLKIIYQNDSLALYYNEEILSKMNFPDESFYQFILYHEGTTKIKYDNVRFYAYDVGTVSKKNHNNFQKTDDNSNFYIPFLKTDYKLTSNK